MEVLKETEKIKVIKLEITITNTYHVTNTYLIIDKETNNGIIIDPADNAKYIQQILEQEKINLKKIILTHAHADHMGAVKVLLEKNEGINIYVHELDKDINNERINEQDKVYMRLEKIPEERIITLKDGEIIKENNITLEVIHTPGHTKGASVLLDKENNILYSGDTIFHNTYGRTDLYHSQKDKMKETLDNLFNRFEDIEVYPGHDEIFNLKDAKRKIRLLFAYKG